jgi:hypothetical protein
MGASQSTKGMTMIDGTLSLDDLVYLGKVAEAIKTDKASILPQLTTICPECDEETEPLDGAHLTLNTTIGAYWAERGEIDPLGMTPDDQPFVLIGCEGYHLIRF